MLLIPVKYLRNAFNCTVLFNKVTGIWDLAFFTLSLHYLPIYVKLQKKKKNYKKLKLR